MNKLITAFLISQAKDHLAQGGDLMKERSGQFWCEEVVVNRLASKGIPWGSLERQELLGCLTYHDECHKADPGAVTGWLKKSLT